MIDTFSGDNKVVDPGPLSEGFARYAESDMEHFVFEFLLNYVRRMKSDLDWKKLLKKNPEKPFVLFVTPSDIAFILSLIKNGMKMWDQAKGQEDNPTERESKAQPLFTKGEGQKRESGMSVWSNEGLNFYYTTKKNWKNAYNDRDELSICVINGNDGNYSSLSTNGERNYLLRDSLGFLINDMGQIKYNNSNNNEYFVDQITDQLSYYLKLSNTDNNIVTNAGSFVCYDNQYYLKDINGNLSNSLDHIYRENGKGEILSTMSFASQNEPFAEKRLESYSIQ